MLESYESPNVFSVRSVRKMAFRNVSGQKIITCLLETLCWGRFP